jgi:ribosomal protein L32
MVDKRIVTYLTTAVPLFKQAKEKKTDKRAVTETLETRNTYIGIIPFRNRSSTKEDERLSFLYN